VPARAFARRFRWFLVVFLCLVAARGASATDYHWIGAGTGGKTSTDPADATTQWAGASNWQEGGAPTSGATVYLPLANAGSVYAATTTLGDLWLDGTSTDGVLSITGGVTLTVNTAMYVGKTQSGKATQAGGTCEVKQNLTLGSDALSSGFYELSGTAVLHAATAGYCEYVGYAGAGTFTQSGGTHTVNDYLYLGYYAGSSGTYQLSGSASLDTGWTDDTPAGRLYVGYYGNGTFIQTGGTHTVGWNLTLGCNAGSTGSYELSDTGVLSTGTLAYPSTGRETIGSYGKGTFTQKGGTNSIHGDLLLGAKAGGSGTYDLSSGDLTDAAAAVGSVGSGTFIQRGGTHTVGTSLSVGTGKGAATYDLSSGLLNVKAYEYIGSGGTGTFTQEGGTNTVKLGLQLGCASGISGTYTLSSGALNSTSSNIYDYIGYSGTGTFNQTGGTHSISGSLFLGYNWYSSGSYDLSGGQLDVFSYEGIGYDGAATFTQTGGTHTAHSTLDVGFGIPGTYSLSSGNLNAMAIENIQWGTFTQSGGTHTVYGILYADQSVYPNPTYTLSSGDLIAKSDEYIGYSLAGIFVQTGGTHTVTGAFYLGYNATVYEGNGYYALSSGDVNALSTEYVGHSGTGHFIQTGGTHEVGSHMELGSISTGVGTYELSAGTLTVPTINVGVAGPGIFQWTGGTLNVQDIEIGGKNSRFSVGQTAQFAGALHANGGAVEVDLDDTLTLLGEFGTTQTQKTITKNGAGALRIQGPQVYAAGAILSVTEGTVFMDTAAGDAGTHNLEVDVGGGGSDALVVFEADEYLSMLHIMDGGTARLGEGCHVVVLDALWIDGVGEFQNITLTNTPEPATLALLGFGALAAMVRRMRKRR
jgi:hypothetical protein